MHNYLRRAVLATTLEHKNIKWLCIEIEQVIDNTLFGIAEMTNFV